jgi:hypothetical protein
VLSNDLKEKLMYDSNRLVLRDSKIFFQNFSQDVLNKTVSIIKEC